MKKLSCRNSRKNSVMQYKPMCAAFCKGANCNCGYSRTNSSSIFQSNFDNVYYPIADERYAIEQPGGGFYTK